MEKLFFLFILVVLITLCVCVVFFNIFLSGVYMCFSFAPIGTKSGIYQYWMVVVRMCVFVISRFLRVRFTCVYMCVKFVVNETLFFCEFFCILFATIYFGCSAFSILSFFVTTYTDQDQYILYTKCASCEI